MKFDTLKWAAVNAALPLSWSTIGTIDYYRVMIARLFFIFIAVFSLFAGFDELGKLKTLLLPVESFTKTKGLIVNVIQHVDSNPGHAEGAGVNTQVYEVTFEYFVDGVKKNSNAISPMCTYCPADDVKRITGSEPSKLKKGYEVAVFVYKADQKEIAFLEMPRKADMRMQIFRVVLWLIIVPSAAYLFSRASWKPRV